MPAGTLPLTYDECRARFSRAVAHTSGWSLESHPIEARGPHGQELSIDIAVAGAAGAGTVRPGRHVLVTMSGVHGVEGFVGSAMQCQLVERVDAASLPDDVAIVLVHAVNPWGMAWWRRQNESNVDLNRNWHRDHIDPPDNPGYRELHPFLCPAGSSVPTADSFLDPVAGYIDAHGLAWVRSAVSAGQYSHADGLYFGGDRTEESTAILAEVMGRHLSGAAQVVSVDLHTGHGPYGEATILSDQAPGSPGDRWLRDRFGDTIVEATVDNPDATSAPKVGQLGHGFRDLAAGADHHSCTLEIGTVSDTRMILAERAEHWVHLHGDRDDPDHAAIVWEHRTMSTPDDPNWEASALAHGRRVLDTALEAVVEPTT